MMWGTAAIVPPKWLFDSIKRKGVCICIYIYICMYVFMYVYIYICIYVYMYICMLFNIFWHIVNHAHWFLCFSMLG